MQLADSFDKNSFTSVENEAVNKYGIKGLSTLGQAKLGEIINWFTPYIFGIAGLILLLYLLWGGFALMTSGGDPKAVEGAKAKITNALKGFLIMFFAFWLVRILAIITGSEQALFR